MIMIRILNSTLQCLHADYSYSYWLHFGQGSDPILLDGVACSGTESNLVECSHRGYIRSCSHSEDAGLVCPQNRGESILYA